MDYVVLCPRKYNSPYFTSYEGSPDLSRYYSTLSSKAVWLILDVEPEITESTFLRKVAKFLPVFTASHG
jgi:hypothetical protein